MSPVDIEQFRLDDYKLKLAHLNAQADRMWTRFNYFVTIQAGLVGFFAIASSHQFRQRALWASLAEVVVSLVWWTVGARDRFLWRAGRRNVEKAANALLIESKHLPSYEDIGPETGYVPVGELDPFADEMHREALARYRKWDPRLHAGQLLGEQGNTRLGVTMIPMLVPLCATALWWVAFVAALATRYADGWLALLALPLVVVLLWLLISLFWAKLNRPNGGSCGMSAGRRIPLLLCAFLLIVGVSAVAIGVAHNMHGPLASFLFALIAVSLLLAVAALVFLLISNRLAALASAAILLGVTLAVTFTIKPSLSFDGPKGEPGPLGKHGPPGQPGPSGERGPPGQHGPPGHNGNNGKNGKNGRVGPRGEEGRKGTQGTEGKPGPQGERGPRGYPGGS